MNGFLKSIFLMIANKLGLKLETKREVYNDFEEVSKISITAAMSDRVSTLTLMDSDANVIGASVRARFLDDFLDRFWNTRIKTACVVSLGTGDCILKPSTDGQRFDVSIVKNNDFVITDRIGDFLKGIVMRCDIIKKDNDIYERLEYHSLNEQENGLYTCLIHQMAFKNGKEINIASVADWAEMPTDIMIPNVDRLLLGRIKCPSIDRQNPNSPNGVPITFGADEVLEEAKNSIRRFNKEFADKETLIFADKTVLERDKDGNVQLPRGKSNLFVKFRGAIDESKIETYSPDIRSTALIESIETNLKIVEMLTGLSHGILTAPTTNFATATEIRASLNQTYAYLTNFRKAIGQGVEDLLNAVNVLTNANEITPIGDYEFRVEWSDKLMENAMETFNQMLNAKAVGELQDGELRSWLMNEDLETAQEKVAEIGGTDEPIV